MHWEKMTEVEGGDLKVAEEYVKLARSVLSSANANVNGNV